MTSLAALVVLLAAVSACTPISRPADESGFITLVTGRDASQGGVRHQLVDQWNLARPDQKVRVIELPSSSDLQHSQMLAAEQSGDTTYDVLNIDVTWTAEFADSAAIQPLDPAILTTNGWPNDFLPGSLKSVRYKDRVWGVPFNADAGLLYYRKDLLDAVGEQAPATWNELRNTANRVKTKFGGSPEAAYVSQLKPYEGLTVNAMEAALSYGEDLTSLNAESAGLDNLAEYVRRGIILGSSLDYDENDSLQAFKDGKAVFLRNWPYAYNVLTTTMPAGTSIGVASLPGHESHDGTRGQSVLGGQNLAVAGHTAKPQLARELIAFLTSPDSEQCLIERGGLAAARTGPYQRGHRACGLAPQQMSGTEAGRTRSLYQDAVALDVLYQALSSAQPRPQTKYYPHVTRVIQKTVTEMLRAADSTTARQVVEQLPVRLGRALSGK